jgi:hypothetical protein
MFGIDVLTIVKVLSCLAIFVGLIISLPGFWLAHLCAKQDSRTAYWRGIMIRGASDISELSIGFGLLVLFMGVCPLIFLLM